MHDLRKLEPGNHLCCIYETDDEHRALLTPYIRGGLEHHQKVVYIVDNHRAETVLEYLRNDGIDPQPALDAGQLAIVTRRETYLRDGTFDPDRMIVFLRETMEQALRDGYSALRVTGEMTWALGSAPGSERLFEYEAKLNDFLPGSRGLAICQYDRRRFSSPALLDVLRTHPLAIVGGQLHKNPYYTPVAEMLDRTHPDRELRRWMDNLGARTRLEQGLRENEARIREMNAELECRVMERTAKLGAANLELERQKRQVDEASRLKSAFLSNMSHELRTPLNSVIALAGVLGRRLAGKVPEEERSYLEVIERNGKNLLLLINDVLDLSRIEAGREDIRIGRFSVGELTAEVVAMLGPQAQEKGIALESRIPADLPLAATDGGKCRHIVQNLVANAVKFTDRGGVTVSATLEGGTLELAVADTGIGIAADQQEAIFEEFRQVDDGTSRRYGGTGLGLAIARRYARMLGGEVGVSSELGKGSTFTLRLPTATSGTDGSDLRRTPRTGPKALRSTPPRLVRGRRILLVEDSEPAVVQLTDVLKVEGYVVDVARNGREAFERVAVTLPDAVILDLMMPEVDASICCGSCAAPRTARLPVLILTAELVSRAG